MLTCRACLRRAFIPLIQPRVVVPTTLTSRYPSASTRTYATESPTPSQATRDSFLEGAGNTTAGETSGDSNPDKRRQQKLRFAVRKHLEHLHDTYTITQHVMRTLRATGDARFDETLLLVQTASRDHSCTVAWTYLIDHQLRMHRLRPAIKLFNEMKKRGQKPNEQTYTTIFRGCAENPNRELAVSEAVRVYNSMLKDAAVRPNIIHANAVLRVCAVAGDLDAMFAFLDKIQEEDKLRLDAKTYATILQSLRVPLADPESTKDLSAEDKKAKLDVMLKQCDEIWKDVISRSRKGELAIDEKLVCAMGRALLLGDVNKKKTVFALLETTLGLPRFDLSETPAAPAPPRKPANASGRAKFNAMGRADTRPAKPGTDTLALVLQAAKDLHHVQVGRRYWNHLVYEKGVVPDNDLWHRFLDLMHLGRSSAEAARVLAAMPAQAVRPNTVRTALLTCLRNIQNPNVVANARAVLDVMLRVFEGRAPDAKALWFFLQVAHRRAGPEKAAGDKAWRAFCEQGADALQAMWPAWQRAADAVILDQIVAERRIPFRDEKKIANLVLVVDVARDMVALMSKIVEGVDGKTRGALESRASGLNRQVVIFTELRDKRLREEKKTTTDEEAAAAGTTW